MRKTILFLCTVILFSCGEQSTGRKVNQQRRSISPNKKYVLQVSIISNEQHGFKKWWQIKITDTATGKEFIDNDNFPARFNVYWNWGPDNRVWLYNSDDGGIYYWEQRDSIWTENKYDRKKSQLAMPDNFLPDYARYHIY